MVQAEPKFRSPKPLDVNSLFFTIIYQIELYIRLNPSLWGLKIVSQLQKITLTWRKKHQNFITCIWGKEDMVYEMPKTLFKRRDNSVGLEWG